MAKQKYTTLEPIEHDKKPIAVGSEISLDDEDAEPLLRVKAIEPITEEEAPAAKGKK